jgi:hypothetical protein
MPSIAVRHGLLAAAVLTLGSVAAADVPKLPSTGIGPITPVAPMLFIDYSFKSCVLATPDKVITALDLTKTEGTHQAWQGSLASPVPLGSKSHLFYGLADPKCPRMWVTDFAVSSSTIAKQTTGTSYPKIDPYFLAGDRERSGKWAKLNQLDENELLTSVERGGCDATPHTYKGTTYDTKQKCYNAASKEVCSRLLRHSVAAFKKDGSPDFKVYTSSWGGFLWDGTFCAPSVRFSYQIFDPTYNMSNAAADGLRALPIPNGRHDVYRVSANLLLYTKPLTVQDGNAADHGQSTADAMFLYNPKMYPPSQNPLVEQLPVEAVLQPSTI